MQQRAAAVIKLYDGKTDLNEEALQELEQLRKDVTAFPLTPLANEQIRLIDRILQENLKPRYSVIIKDDSHDSAGIPAYPWHGYRKPVSSIPSCQKRLSSR